MQATIVLLPGDGIGPEVVREARAVLELVAARYGHTFHFTEHLIGGAAIDATCEPLPTTTLTACERADAAIRVCTDDARAVGVGSHPRSCEAGGAVGAAGCEQCPRPRQPRASCDPVGEGG